MLRRPSYTDTHHRVIIVSDSLTSARSMEAVYRKLENWLQWHCRFSGVRRWGKNTELSHTDSFFSLCSSSAHHGYGFRRPKLSVWIMPLDEWRQPSPDEKCPDFRLLESRSWPVSSADWRHSSCKSRESQWAETWLARSNNFLLSTLYCIIYFVFFLLLFLFSMKRTGTRFARNFSRLITGLDRSNIREKTV